MSEIFNFNRYCKTVKSDLNNYGKKAISPLIILTAIMPFNLMLRSILGGNEVSIETRINVLGVLTFILLYIVPFIMYKNANHRKRGVDYIMLPASGLEKFLSMLFICSILTPIIFIGSYLIVDTIMALIPNRFYNGKFLFTPELITWDNIKVLLTIIMFQSTTLCGNMLFRKNKAGKTILATLAILFLTGSLIATYFFKTELKTKYPDIEAINIQNKKDKSVIITTNNGNPNVINGELLEKEKKESTDKKQAEQEGDKTLKKELVDEQNEEFSHGAIEDEKISYDNVNNHTFSGNEINNIMWEKHNTFIYTIIILYYLFFASMYFITFWRIKRQQI